MKKTREENLGQSDNFLLNSITYDTKKISLIKFTMGIGNCAERVLFQLSNEKSPTTGTPTNTSTTNSSFIFIVVENEATHHNSATNVNNIQEVMYFR